MERRVLVASTVVIGLLLAAGVSYAVISGVAPDSAGTARHSSDASASPTATTSPKQAGVGVDSADHNSSAISDAGSREPVPSSANVDISDHARSVLRDVRWYLDEKLTLEAEPSQEQISVVRDAMAEFGPLISAARRGLNKQLDRIHKARVESGDVEYYTARGAIPQAVSRFEFLKVGFRPDPRSGRGDEDVYVVSRIRTSDDEAVARLFAEKEAAQGGLMAVVRSVFRVR